MAIPTIMVIIAIRNRPTAMNGGMIYNPGQLNLHQQLINS
jgi:hypothetical protein